MKARLLWDRFLRWWLPPEMATGDAARDIDAALRRTYERSDGKTATFAQKGGTSVFVVTEAATCVASVIPPHGRPPPPGWLTRRPRLAGGEIRRFLDGAVRDLAAAPRPHIIARTGRRPLTFGEIRVGEGTVVIVNEPDKSEIIDAVRIARARRALGALRTPAGAEKARKLLAERETAPDADSIDRKLRATIRRLKLDDDAFFDAMELLEGVTRRELKLAGEKP